MQYVNTLKPKYSSVDLTEVELPEMDYSTTNIQYDEAREDENNNLLLDVSDFYIYIFSNYIYVSVLIGMYRTSACSYIISIRRIACSQKHVYISNPIPMNRKDSFSRRVTG